MSWAAERKTTRREDIAYCLMGIFNVNMPLLYGEGDKAFMRLQEEIIKQSTDQSLLAHNPTLSRQARNRVLADTPKAFASYGRIVQFSAA